MLPGRRQAIIWTNDGILLMGPLGKTSLEFDRKLYISFQKKYLYFSSAKWLPFCLGLKVLSTYVYWLAILDME